jgi:flavin reductase (DIM6/NTAB) family NADH-FMN oxidoreductase RutF
VIDSDTFKDMMSSVAATVTIVTAPGDDGPVGITVTAFMSVSVVPPIVLVCIDKGSGTLPSYLNAPGFTVNFMPEGMGDDAMVFATRGVDKFGTVPHVEPELGIGGPVIASAFGHFECRTVERTEMGDHWVLYGEVAGSDRSDTASNPLVWLNRGFASVTSNTGG